MGWLRWHQLRRQRQRACRRYARHPFADPLVQQLLEAPLPSPSLPWHLTDWLAVDLETTSLDPTEGAIVSLGWVAIDEGRIRPASARHRVIDSPTPVGQSATLHQIRDCDQREGLDLASALRLLSRALTGRLLILHHAPLDTGYLKRAYREQFGAPWIHPVADTLQLERRKLLRQEQGLPPGCLRLHQCRARYGLPEVRAHDALEDALATAELFLAWAAHYGGEGPCVRDCLDGRL